MRQGRFFAPPDLEVAYYHCISRVVDRRFIFENQEKEQFLHLMRMYEAFGHLRVLAFCVMGNHFHILVEVPKRPPQEEMPGDDALVEHVRNTLGDKSAKALQADLERLRGQGADAGAEAIREGFFARMWNISAFMQSLKRRFSQWYNHANDRCGTLWEGRYFSLLIEGECHVLLAMAAYIELNPLRAKMVDDPKDYRWSSYGEAIGSGGLALRAVQWLVGIGHRHAQGEKPSESSETAALEQYRRILFGVEGGSQRGLDPERVKEVLMSGGKLPLADYIRCRARYFTAGVVLGSRAFVDEIFARRRERFSARRVDGARPMRGLADEVDLCTCRDLRVRLFG